ncbi:MAG: hypothetical protein GY755_06095 [Chloroflexi bacterium]|nr:hypothetical protein [Chloroflexota bacterium]
MYKIQKGIIPRIASFAGLFFHLVAVVSSVIMVYQDTTESLIGQSWTTGELIWEIVFYVIFALFILYPIFLISGVLLLLFPEIRLVSEGIKYRSFIYRGVIKWEEVHSLIKLKNDIIVITIKRSFSLLRGLILFKLFGMIVGHDYPVLFLAPKLEEREEILAEIMKKSSAKSIKTKKDLYT